MNSVRSQNTIHTPSEYQPLETIIRIIDPETIEMANSDPGKMRMVSFGDDSQVLVRVGECIRIGIGMQDNGRLGSIAALEY